MDSVGLSWAPRTPLDVSFQDLSVNIDDKTVLQRISGECHSGELLAVMGPSGSGKTTLLNLLSGRLKVSGGLVQVGGEALSKTTRRQIGYVLQQDIFFTSLTLRQTVTYAALLRMPDHMSYKDKIAYVDYIIDLLDLRRCQHTIIGDVMKRGLSGGEKKRTNIACELLTNPSVMLIDEPTSGLDSSTALSLMSTLKEFAEKENKTVIVTLHQPSSRIFHMVDKLLLLCDGQSAYFGKTSNVVDHFASVGLPINPHYNPAELILEHVRGSIDIRSRLIQSSSRTLDPSDSYKTPVSVDSLHNGNHSYINPTVGEQLESRRSSRISIISDSIELIKAISANNDNNNNVSTAKISTNHTCIKLPHVTSASDLRIMQKSKWTTSFFTQVKVLSQRNFTVALPNLLSYPNCIQTLVLAFIAGLTWFNIGRTEVELADIQGWMFFSTTYWMLHMLFQAMGSFPSERAVISKERASGSYRASAYDLAKMIGELPLTLTLPSLYLLISYPLMMGSNINIYVLLTHLVMLLLNALVAQSVGLLIGAVCMDMRVGMTVSAIFTLFSQLFGGYLAARISPWLTWAKYLSIIHYAFQNMNIIEFQYGSEVRCLETNSRFVGCNGTAEYIPVSDILSERGGDYQPIWLNTTVLISFMLIVRLLTYFVLRFVHSS